MRVRSAALDSLATAEEGEGRARPGDASPMGRTALPPPRTPIQAARELGSGGSALLHSPPLSTLSLDPWSPAHPSLGAGIVPQAAWLSPGPVSDRAPRSDRASNASSGGSGGDRAQLDAAIVARLEARLKEVEEEWSAVRRADEEAFNRRVREVESQYQSELSDLQAKLKVAHANLDRASRENRRLSSTVQALEKSTGQGKPRMSSERGSPSEYSSPPSVRDRDMSALVRELEFLKAEMENEAKLRGDLEGLIAKAVMDLKRTKEEHAAETRAMESTHRQREEVSRDQVRDAGSKLRTAEQMIDALRQHVASLERQQAEALEDKVRAQQSEARAMQAAEASAAQIALLEEQVASVTSRINALSESSSPSTKGPLQSSIQSAVEAATRRSDLELQFLRDELAAETEQRRTVEEQLSQLQGALAAASTAHEALGPTWSSRRVGML